MMSDTVRPEYSDAIQRKTLHSLPDKTSSRDESTKRGKKGKKMEQEILDHLTS